MPQHTTEDNTLATPYFVLHNQHLAIDSKSIPILKPATLDSINHARSSTTHPKNKCEIVSFSLQNRQVRSSTFLFPLGCLWLTTCYWIATKEKSGSSEGP
jgi:hypothetical protein